ncbi:MFS general substrate transporter [Coniochaeta ligniaria NRRL 30616]|uniref:MFS general substrate transporter n=1 Tax=Coniochaeta ligniaria NRRL 30616 TaxID=1408157 RepID=A0A1J7JB92_9PEZI|nr:MFS general substrate transporter [Coniochaeta ligniaria NRRL 30616]
MEDPTPAPAHLAHPWRNRLKAVLSELGLVSLYHCKRDVKLLCLQRFVRLFAYGSSTLVLVSYLEALGISKTRIGLFMTLTLAGDVCISFFLTLFADGIGRKAVLALGAALMVGSGVVFALFENYYVLLAAAIFGVISPSGNEIGPFRAIEESVVAHLTASSHRSDIYAWYNLIATAGVAFGMMTCGWTVNHFTTDLKWDIVDAYRLVFFGYAAMGALKFLIILFLSKEVEADEPEQITPPAEPSSEVTPLLGDIAPPSAKPAPQKRRGLASLLPQISHESRGIMVSLCLLFALDSFASGLAPLSWVTYFFRSRYDLSEGALGSIFFTTSIIAAGSMLVASSLAKRFGNVNTMVFTHLPSAVFLALIPVPNDVHWSLLFLILRSCTQSMDGPPRSAFLAAIVLPGERTAIMGLVNVVKSTAQSLSPTLTGLLADKKLFWVAFVCAGTLKASYDLGMLALFKNHERERAERERLAAERRVGDEDEVGA